MENNFAASNNSFWCIPDIFQCDQKEKFSNFSNRSHIKIAIFIINQKIQFVLILFKTKRISSYNPVFTQTKLDVRNLSRNRH